MTNKLGIPEKEDIRKLLTELKEKEVRINYHDEKSTYLGKINDVGREYAYLLPYVVWESLPTPIGGVFLQRGRIEESIYKPIPIKSITPDPLSTGYIEDFVKWTNYFSFRQIKDKKLKDKIFNKNYLLPTNEETKLIEKEIKLQSSKKKARKSDN